jgi:hypothetical protein
MATIGFIILGLAFLVSVLFNWLQLKWRNEQGAARAKGNAEQERQGDKRDAAQRLQQRAAPLFLNFDGTPGPIRVIGSQHSSQGPFMFVWGMVTVVNLTQMPVKVTPLRLIMAGEEWPAQSISFHRKSNATERSDRISLRGNGEEDYELHFRFPDDKCATGTGDLWFASDNRPEEFSVPVEFQQ